MIQLVGVGEGGVEDVVGAEGGGEGEEEGEGEGEGEAEVGVWGEVDLGAVTKEN